MTPLSWPIARFDNSITAQPTKNFTIFPSLIRTAIEKDDYYFYFNNMCATQEIQRNGLKVDQKVLEQKLKAWLKPGDRDYIKLVYFDTNKSIFKFDIDKWFADGLKNISSKPGFTTFSRDYKLSKMLPIMVRVYGLEMSYTKFIADKFKSEIKKNSKLRNTVSEFIENLTAKKLSIDKTLIFDYTYDKVSNSINVSIKPMYFGMIMAAISLYTQKKEKVKTVDFDKTVNIFLRK